MNLIRARAIVVLAVGLVPASERFTYDPDIEHEE